VYQFESRIMRRPERDNCAFLTLPRNFKRVQRRLFVRIEYRERVEYALVGPTTNWSGWPRSLEWADAMSCDISGGGMRIAGDNFVAVGTILLLRLPSFKGEGLPEFVLAVCRRVMREEKAVFLGLEFLIRELMDRATGAPESALLPAELRRFDRSVQNKLVVWIFQRQIYLRQKGLL
jgi:c-di-GMP-binding flagellar brake protein YcgR